VHPKAAHGGFEAEFTAGVEHCQAESESQATATPSRKFDTPDEPKPECGVSQAPMVGFLFSFLFGKRDCNRRLVGLCFGVLEI